MAAEQPDHDATQRIADAALGVSLTAGRRVFGRYLLETEIGRGGMGVVWRAQDETLGETIALKFLPAAVARDAVSVDELKEETRKARRLRHPNIVSVFDFVQDEAIVAVSMEWIDGTTLSQFRLTQPGKVFSPDHLAPLLSQICSALDYAHDDAKVAHRDLKPANVLVTRDGKAKLADFGIARSLTETHTRVTGKNGGTSGTLLYMSPQQLRGRRATPSDDIYALGATLYELIAGKPPFFSGELLHQILNETPEPLAERRVDYAPDAAAIPPEWERLILSCLAKNPEERPATAGAVLAMLNGVVSSEKTPVAAPEPTIVAPAEKRRVEPQPVSTRPASVERQSPAGMGVAQNVSAATQPASAVSYGRGVTPRPRPNVLRFFATAAVILAVVGLGSWYVGVRLPEQRRFEAERNRVAPPIAKPTTPVAAARDGRAVTTTPAGTVELRIADIVLRIDPNLAVRIDGKPIVVAEVVDSGTIPIRVEGVSVGSRVVAITHPDYEPWQRSVSVSDDQTATVEVKLTPKPGRLAISAEPPNVVITINGRAVRADEIKNGELTVPTGESLALTASAKGYKSATSTITLPANGREMWRVTLEKISRLESGQPWTIPDLRLALVPIPAGTFMMGSADAGAGSRKSEGPQTHVTMSQPFWLGKTEVTQREWEAVMGNNPMAGNDPSRSAPLGVGDDLPIGLISWAEAATFCQKLTERERAADRLPVGMAYTLPTEAQWEYACRAGTTGDYAGELSEMGWYRENSNHSVHPVGMKTANPWGLHDMHGNVAEWCIDSYKDKLPGGTVRDLKVSVRGDMRVYRGGDTGCLAIDCRSAKRNAVAAASRLSGLGFRLALSLDP